MKDALSLQSNNDEPLHVGSLKVHPSRPHRERWKQVKLTNRALVNLIGQSAAKWITTIVETLMKSKNGKSQKEE